MTVGANRTDVRRIGLAGLAVAATTVMAFLAHAPTAHAAPTVVGGK